MRVMKVKIKDLQVGGRYNGVYLNEAMGKYLGMQTYTTVITKDGNCKLEIDNGEWVWDKFMLEFDE